METFADRIRTRIGELNLTQADLARASGCSPQRFNNYLKKSNPRQPDLETLKRIAAALRTTTDWLLGLSDLPAEQIEAVVRHLLELDGMPKDQAERMAKKTEEAMALLSTLPDGGSPQVRAILAAEAVWRLRP